MAIDAVVSTPDESADLERLATGLQRPWRLAFTPNGEILITEKYRGVRVMKDGVLLPEILAGGPVNVFAMEDSGILDVALDPDFERNRMIYLAFAEGDDLANHTSVWKARYDGRRLTNGRVIFRCPDKAGSSHPGGRMLFLPDRAFLLTVGDGYTYRAAAQDLGSNLGKILRLSREGSPPADNPFFASAGALPEIWPMATATRRGSRAIPLSARSGNMSTARVAVTM